MASDTFIGDGLAKSPYREILEKVIQLEQEVAELKLKIAKTSNLLFGPTLRWRRGSDENAD